MALAVCGDYSFAATATDKQKPLVIPGGDTVVGRCVGVHDGNSMTLLVDTPAGPRQSKIRLDAIDAPGEWRKMSKADRKVASSGAVK